MIFVDSSVLLDMLEDDAVWGARSTKAFRLATARDRTVISDIVYAECAPGFRRKDDLDSALDLLDLATIAPPRSALFLAGHAFRQYRRQKGAKTNVLPDFLIGAHAAVEGASLLTRDPARVRAYFPTVDLIAP
jgi:predicted nucleic acid-binding protein